MNMSRTIVIIGVGLRMDMVESKLGPRIKRLFIAFLISNLVSYVQVWLGMEYNNLAKEFDAMSAQDSTHSSNLARASLLFKKAARLTFTLFGLGIATAVISYSMDSNLMMSMIRTTYISSSYFPSMITTIFLPILIMLIIILITNSGINLANNSTLNKAWNLVLSHFTENCASMAWMPGASKQVERILKGLNKSKISYWLLIITSILLTAFFAILFRFMMNVVPISVYSLRAYLYAMLAVGIVLIVFFAIGTVFSMLGMINQAVGLFDLGKALQGNFAPSSTKPAPGDNRANQQPASRGTTPQGREVPMAMERRFCPICGAQLEPDWNAKFCPKCGEKLS